DVYVMNANGTNVTNVTISFPPTVRSFEWSPDGTKFVLEASLGLTESDIFVIDADGTNPANITTPKVVDRLPSWSPDGSRIAFASTREGITQLNVINVDGTNAATLANIRTLDRPAWSPDGTRIVFSGVQPSGYRAIFGVNADGSNLVNLSNQEGTSAEQPALSPDGQKIVYRLAVPNSQNVPSNGQIYIMNSDGSNQQMLLDTESSFLFREWENPRWAPDSNQIVFTGSCFSALPTQQPCARGIIVIRADGTGLTQITDGFTRDFQPDWRRN
ncbi:MAG: PD40 domain-containing protein, partial [Roseiflexaceae bacterium]|nr:PD40 domain-containing protein [Roseiflexaceae bacterium]